MRLLRLVELSVVGAGFIIQAFVLYATRALSNTAGDILAIALTIFASVCVLSVPYVQSRRRLIIAPAALALIGLGFFPWQGFLMLTLLGILGSRMALLYGERGAVAAWIVAALAIGVRSYIQMSLLATPLWLFIYSAGTLLVLLALLFTALAVLAKTLVQVREHAARAAENGALAERSRIAIELHDALGHRLTTASVQLQTADSLLATDMPGAQRFLKRADRSIAGALNEVRETVGLLRDANPEIHLSQRLGALFEDFSSLGLVDLNWSVDVGSQPSAAAALALFRIVQESLTNVARHAGPCAVKASVTEHDGFIQAIVSDTGTGFDPANVVEGTGLRAMQERIAVLGGTLDVRSEPGAGTIVDARLPQPVGA